MNFVCLFLLKNMHVIFLFSVKLTVKQFGEVSRKGEVKILKEELFINNNSKSGTHFSQSQEESFGD